MKPILFNTDMVKAILAGKKTVTRRVIKPQPSKEVTPRRLDAHCWSFDVLGTPIRPDYPVRITEPYWPPYQPGDVLYVRETWASTPDLFGEFPQYIYRADYDERDLRLGEGNGETLTDFPACVKWRPSIHMPKEAARIFLRVTAVRAERLQSITPEQAIREGISRMFDHLPDDEYVQWAARVAPGKKKTDWGWDNYLWHGDFGNYGMGNKLSDAWPYQYSGYDEPVGSFSSLWNKTLPLKEWPTYGWEANPWVWVIEFERCERPGMEQEADNV